MYLGLDLGTNGMKAVATDDGLNVVASAQCGAPLIQDGDRREFDADDFCSRVFGLIKSLGESGAPLSDVKAVCFASASGNTVFLDKDFRPLCNAFSWTDRRLCGKEDVYLKGFDVEHVHQITGWPYLGIFPLAHIAWMKRERPELWEQCEKLGMSTEYLIYRLCGSWASDYSTATAFYLVDQIKRAYCPEYLNYFSIREPQLPVLLDSAKIVGHLTAEAAGICGLPKGTPVVAGSFDHPACARGMGALDEGDLLLSCGTSWALLLPTKKRPEAINAGLLIDPFRQEDGLWAGIGAVTQYGEYIDARIARFIDGTENKFNVFNKLTAETALWHDAPVVDLMDESVCERTWEGLTPQETACSIMKSTCKCIRDRIDALENQNFAIQRVFMAGGASSSEWWPQMMANMLERPVMCLHRQFGGAVGAAAMAIKGLGACKDERALVCGATGYTEYKPC